MSSAQTTAAPPQRASLLMRVWLGALMVLVALNIWTGSPLLAVWIASHVQDKPQLTMSGLLVVVLVFGALSLTLVRLLAVLGARYESATGQSRTVRSHVPWLRSMRGERQRYPGEKAHVTMLERVLIVTIVIAVCAFEFWFFFLAGSSIPTWAPNSM